MVVEHDVPTFWTWLFGGAATDGSVRATPSALVTFALTLLTLVTLALLFGSLVAVARFGWGRGLALVGSTLRTGLVDLVWISPRRVLGLSTLAFREAMRMHIWVIAVLFVIALMFAAWALGSDSPNPAKLYLTFVSQTTSFLLMFMAIFLGALSLPMDIFNRTIYTVVTKPVRASELLLGRFLGFTFVGTVFLVLMGVASYVFVSRMVVHEHELTAEAMAPVREEGAIIAYEGTTSRANGHVHTVRLDADAFRPPLAVRTDGDGRAVVSFVTDEAREAGIGVGDRIVAIDGEPLSSGSPRTPSQRLRGPAGSAVQVTTEPAAAAEGDRSGQEKHEFRRTRARTETNIVRGHTHPVQARFANGVVSYAVGPPEGDLTARVPKYGTLRFRDRNGIDTRRGISVGDIDKRRSFIRGGRLDAAIWSFSGLDAEDLQDGLPLDLSIGVYRSHKGDVEQGVRGSLVVRNPATGQQSQELVFTALENKLDQIDLPRRMIDQTGQPLDLPSDLVHEGEVEVWIRCIDPGQYFGMAPADLYVRAAESSYAANFAKRYFQIWLQMILVIAVALLCSTFLSGPVAIMLTGFVAILGYATGYLYNLTQCVIFRHELAVFDAFRLRRMPLDEAGLREFQRLHEMNDGNNPPFSETSIDSLRYAQSIGIDQLEVLDRVYGGGPLEAGFRIFTQNNLLSPLPDEPVFWLMQWVDGVLMRVVRTLLNVMPDFERFATDSYLAGGYNINSSLIAQQVCTTLAFVLATIVAGYFFLKTREIAR
ncbi:MAG: hypothetical protein DWQ42_14835 [Planctomycetota bacterium]|nr:MAG: hypothetical protein DWQ42_14835 [Planctomycetota bacterium]REK47619.1 MAG: hypothetical protein DWQ46_04115 [Planctomycetota bacterium]